MTPKLTDKKRAAIVLAAIGEFDDRGFAAATMDGIAARAGVSKRTVYKHFPSKEELFLQISKQVCEAAAQATEMPFDETRSVEDQLMELALRQLELIATPDFLTMARVTLPERVHNPALRTESFDALRRGETGLGRWLESAVASGALDLPEPKFAGRRFSAMLMEFSFWPILFAHQDPPSKEECQNIARETVRLFLNGCLPKNIKLKQK